MSLLNPEEEEEEDRLRSSFDVDHKRRGALKGRVLISLRAVVGDIDDEGVDEGLCFIREGGEGEADDDDDGGGGGGNTKAESLARCSLAKEEEDD